MRRAVGLAIALGACRSGSTPTPSSAPSMDAGAPSVVASARPVEDAAAPVRPELVRLCASYACTAEADRVRLPDGTTFAWDDGKPKTTQERIDRPDVEDIFFLEYPAVGTAIAPVVDAEIDPGRVRLEPLFRATYGVDARAVSAAMVTVKIGGHTVSFHRRAAPALERVAARIEKQPELARYFSHLGGTFNPRNIAGTDHASAHSWAIAIDIDPSFSDYWRNGPSPPKWKNRVPQAVVDAFEAEGFVWGGRWFHYDTMHFEYRPELFPAGSAGLAPGSPDSR